MSATRPDRETIKSWTQPGVTSVTDLLAMDGQTDPFYAELPSREVAGRWFSEVYQRFGFRPGAHLRGIHYRLVVQPVPVLMPSGEPYENAERCWTMLGMASASARYLGLVDPEAFVDRRAPQPLLLAASRPTPQPWWSAEESWWSLPSIDPHLDINLSGAIPDLEVSGYDYDPADQPYLLECWIEKSTMDDVLQPVCRRLGMNLITGVGYMSITTVIAMLKRVAEHRKPARILYISDFDGSGQSMPISAARQAEFWLSSYAPEADLKLTPVALSREQVEHYNLPRSPIQDSNQLKRRFEEQQGAGACELDALEELFPGELARLVRAAAEPYVDFDLRDELDAADREARAEASAAWETHTTDERNELAEIEADAEELADQYREELAVLATHLADDLAPIKARIEALSQASALKCSSLDVYLPPRPEPAVEPPSESGWLYASDREYREQLRHYHMRRPPNRTASKAYALHEVLCKTCGKTFTARKANAATCSTPCRSKLTTQRRRGAA